MSKKPGVVERVKSAWSTLRGGKEISTEEALSQTGLDIIKTQTFDKRIDNFEDFNSYINNVVQKRDEEGKTADISTPEKKVTFFKISTNGINERLHKIAIPWGTGGEAGWYSDVAFGWAEIYTHTLFTISSVERLLEMGRSTEAPNQISSLNADTRSVWRPPINKATLVEKLDYFFTTVTIQYAQKVADISWFSRDVVPTKVAMVSNIPQNKYGGLSLQDLDAMGSKDEMSDG
jgi:hypothetical protein